ncbi:hypothetical protein KKB55_07460, partial [Myxococcota bacterium]|nr:hypothetical protein [Myxococcota bacterium]
PAAPPGGGLNLGGDLFAKPAAPAPAAAPAPRGGGLNLGGDLFAKPAAPPPSQADLAGQFEFDEPEDEGGPEGPAEFANPLQMGEYTQAAAPIDLSAAEEEALAAFEGKQAGMKLSMALSITGGVGLLMLVIGLSMGSVRNARKQINIQVEDSKIIAERMQPHVDELKMVSPIIQGLAVSLRQNATAVDWDKMKYLPEMKPVDAGMFTSRVPLHPDLARVLNNAISDINKLSAMVNEHKRLTMEVDLAQLKALEQGDDWLKHQNFAVIFTPPEPVKKGKRFTAPPQNGKLAAIIGNKPQLNEEIDKYELLVLTRDDEKPRSVPLDSMVFGISQKDLVTSGGVNVMDLYVRRVRELNLQLGKIMEYQDTFTQVLKREANRSKVVELL